VSKLTPVPTPEAARKFFREAGDAFARYRGHALQGDRSGPPRVVSLRRGRVVISVPELMAGGREAELQNLLESAFQLTDVEEITVDPVRRRLAVGFAFGVSKTSFLRRLAVQIRRRRETTATAHIALPRMDQVNQPFKLFRAGNSFSAWSLRMLRSGVLRCAHPLLGTSAEARLAVEEAMASLPGVDSIRIDPAGARLILKHDPRRASFETVRASLDASVYGLPSDPGSIVPSWRGYAFDGLRMALALGAQVAVPSAVSASGILIVAAHWRQITESLSELQRSRITGNSVVTGIVGLTLLNGFFVQAVLMSLAMRFWKSLEYHEVRHALRRHLENTPRVVDRKGIHEGPEVRYLARSVFSTDEATVRSVHVADSMAAPTLIAGAAGLVVGGLNAGIAAIRPDYYSGPRLASRFLGLAAVLRLASKGIFFSRAEALQEIHASSTWVFDAETVRRFTPADVESCVVALKAHGRRVGIYSNEADEETRWLSESVRADFYQGKLSLEGRAWHLQKLQQADGPVVYVGPSLGWERGKPTKIVSIEPSSASRITSDADAVLSSTELHTLVEMLAEATGTRTRRRAIESLAVVANTGCTLGAVFFGLTIAQVVILSNLATGLIYLASRRQLLAAHGAEDAPRLQVIRKITVRERAFLADALPLTA